MKIKRTHKRTALDYEILQWDLGRGFQVWVPDDNGACIGGGKTRKEAIEDAVTTLLLTATKLKSKL